MFACLYLPRPADRPSSIVQRRSTMGERSTMDDRRSTMDDGRSTMDDGRSTMDDRRSTMDDGRSTIVQLARDFSPRVETHGDRTVTLDISGLGSLIGEPRAIGEELRRAAADAGLGVHIAVAATSTAAILLAHARAGLTVVAPGTEAATLAPLPLRVLTPMAQSPAPEVDQLHRWGLRTLGDLAALPSGELSARLGPTGLRWQRWARGEEIQPLVPAGVAEQFEASLDLEWPIDGLEPLSFVLARLLDPLCERLERGDRGAVVLRVILTLVGGERHERAIELPAPMRESRVLRTLALLDLESNPPQAPIDRVAVAVDVAEGRVLQFGLFARALPTDTLATLLARLGALMGRDRVGAPALVDTYRPGAFAMATFDPPRNFTNPQSPIPNPRLCASESGALRRASPEPSAEAGRAASVLRRFRSPIPARVVVDQGRPVRVTTDRRGYAGGRVERSEGPWRSSGDWWKNGWNCDEWDVALNDGTTFRISHAHEAGAWFVDGMVD
jgi:protein ImuB